MTAVDKRGKPAQHVAGSNDSDGHALTAEIQPNPDDTVLEAGLLCESGLAKDRLHPGVERQGLRRQTAYPPNVDRRAVVEQRVASGLIGG